MPSSHSLVRFCLFCACGLFLKLDDVRSQNERWQTVLKLDSLSTSEIVARGDTILFLYHKDPQGFGLYSTNSGETWDEEYKAEEIWQKYYFPNSPRVFGIVVKNDEEVSGRVVAANRIEHETPLPEDAVNLMGSGFSPYIKFNPVNDDEIILVMERAIAGTTQSAAWQSRDVGRTWRMLEMPFAPEGASEFEFIFDYRDQHHWFVAVHGDHFSYGLSLYETTDGGTSFDYKRLLYYEIDEFASEGSQAGIEGRSIIRYLSPSIGLVKLNVGNGDIDTVNWLEAIKPGADLSNNAAGIEHFLGRFSTSADNPSVSVVHRSEFLFPPGGTREDTVYKTEHDLNLTTDNGITWRKIWSGYLCTNVLLDPDLKSVWIITLDSNLPRRYPLSVTNTIPRSLRRLDLTGYLTHRVGAKLGEFSCSPNPANERLSLNFSLPQSSNVIIRLLDYLGREQQVWNTPHLESGPNQIEIHAPPHLSRGVYLLKVSAEGFNATHKVVLE
jgi:hypothetical protein